jgi:DNA modification methylase
VTPVTANPTFLSDERVIGDVVTGSRKRESKGRVAVTDVTGDIAVFCAHDELVALERIVGNPRNPNTHPDAQIELLAKIISAQGWRAPITVSNLSGFVVRGHGRLAAARLLGLGVAPVDFQDYESEAAEWADLIADNRIAELAEIDSPLLAELLRDIDTEGLDIELSGFDAAGLEALLAEVGAGPVIIEDDVPERPDDPVTKPGDLWVLGDHRLLCGDATDAGDVDRLMRSDKADMVFTDPPWNVAIGLDSNPRHRQRAGLVNDSMPSTEFAAFLAAAGANIATIAGGDVYCVLGASEWPTLDTALRSAGLHWSATVIWVKDTFVLGRSKYHRRYEPIWYGWKDGGTSSFCRRRDLDDVWEIARPKRSEEHPTMKPVELVARAIQNSSKPAGVVADLFAGAGSTLMAAEQLGRSCRAMEIDPGYCDVICARWSALTGREPVLDG